MEEVKPIKATSFDRTLYQRYKLDILKHMAQSNWNLSKSLTALLGPPPGDCYTHNTSQPNYNGAIEAYHHGRTGNSKDYVSAAADRLNDLLLLDKWLQDHGGLSFHNVPTESTALNDYLFQHLWITDNNLKTIFPDSYQDKITVKPNSLTKQRLYLPPKIFHGKKADGKAVNRFDQLFKEIWQHSNQDGCLQVLVSGCIGGTVQDCLYILCVSYAGTWEIDEHQGHLITPKTLFGSFFKGTGLDRYCNYYIVANSQYCHMNSENASFRNITSKRTTMERSGKIFYYYPHVGQIEHILIFDNYKEYNYD